MGTSSIVVAVKNYENAMEQIEALAELAKKTNDKFKVEISKRQYDYIIQASLLHAAIENGKIDGEEIDFMKDITKHGDALSLFNLKIKDEIKDLPDLTWENIGEILTTLSVNGKARFFKKFDTIVGNIADDFVKWFAPIDAKDTAVDYLKLLDTALDGIIHSFTRCHGIEPKEVTDAEIAAAKKAKKSLLVDRWKRAT